MSSADTQSTKCLVDQSIGAKQIIDKIGKIPLEMIVDLSQYSIIVDL